MTNLQKYCRDALQLLSMLDSKLFDTPRHHNKNTKKKIVRTTTQKTSSSED